MPIYFPDLKSVQSCANAMTKNTGDKKYIGIIPKNEEELPQARKELANYFRTVWKDEVQAMEIELSVSENDYEEKMKEGVRRKILGYAGASEFVDYVDKWGL